MPASSVNDAADVAPCPTMKLLVFWYHTRLGLSNTAVPVPFSAVSKFPPLCLTTTGLVPVMLSAPMPVALEPRRHSPPVWVTVPPVMFSVPVPSLPTYSVPVHTRSFVSV